MNINISKRATNLDYFQKDDLHRTVFEYYDKDEFPTVKNVARAHGEKLRMKVQFTSIGPF
jgi:hypothetical protein